MIYEQIELHNIAEVHEVPGMPGVRLQRVPESVRCCLNPGAQLRMLSPASAEIRFVSEGREAQVTLSCPEGIAQAVVFYGPFQGAGGERYQIGAEPVTIELGQPVRLAALDPALLEGLPFHPSVWRLMLSGSPVFLHRVTGVGLRPPSVDELPPLRYLAYGTSITHGAAASGPHLSYVGQVARRLGADLINLGVGGSAYCEPELSDYMAARTDWDIATLALSVNMIGAGFDLDGFRERVSYMVRTIAQSDPHRPVACITIYPHFRDWDPAAAALGKAEPEAFRQALRDVVSGCDCHNVHLIEGPEMLTDWSGLTVDLIHPGDNGMIQMGENLAKRLASLLTLRP